MIVTTAAVAVRQDIKKAGVRAHAQATLRLRLIAAAHELFSNRGFDGCTTSDIALEVGVSQRTFFRYFKSKEDVILQWLDAYNRRICDRLRRRPPQESELEALRRALDHFCHMPPPEAERLSLIGTLIISSTTLRGALRARQSAWEETIAVALSERMGRVPETDYSSKLLAGFAMSILMTAKREGGRGEVLPSLEDLIDLGFTMMRTSSGAKSDGRDG